MNVSVNTAQANNSTSPLQALTETGQCMGRSGTSKPRNSCRRCGATAYKTLIARDDAGAMRPSGQYQCVQCKQVFRDVREWRDGVEVAIGHSNAATSGQTGLVN